ncbi:MAG TPA: sigma-70 family RNA polymerase sigma factor [Opitutaceae bacterium]|nr:sigma-70 family RNA polymerase sigma factor [Opitutaceae bacterium]
MPLLPANDAQPEEIVVLTRRLAAGDEAAFRAFHARYFDPLYQFLLVVSRGDTHAAQEALQETMLRVARRAREFDDEEAFWAWLRAVARNAARDGGRRRRRYFAVLERFGLVARDERNHEADLRALLEETLAELTPDDRELLAGKYLRGATVVELAEANRLTEKTVESRLLRLRRDLAERLRRKLGSP